MIYECPVCKGELEENPLQDTDTFEICSVCGVEFGNDDFLFTHEELRIAWIEAGEPTFHSKEKLGGGKWILQLTNEFRQPRKRVRRRIRNYVTPVVKKKEKGEEENEEEVSS